MKNSSTPVTYSSLTTWQSASTEDVHSLALDPQMSLSAAPVPTNPAADNAGIPYGGITTDILGNVRGAVPDIGAYEFTVSGIGHLLPVTSLHAFPNPCTDHISIRIPENVAVDHISLFDEAGKLQGAAMTVTHNVLYIQVTELKQSFYVVEVNSGSQKFSARFEKL